MKYNIIVNDMEFDVEIGNIQDGFAEVVVNNELFDVSISSYQEAAAPAPIPRQTRPTIARKASPAITRRPQPAATRAAQPVIARPPVQSAAPKRAQAAPPAAVAAKPATTSASGAGAIKAPMPGLMIDIRVKVGDSVKPGQVVAVMEAMKMENDLPSALSGTVKEICVQKGAQVSTGDVLIVIE